MKSKIILTCLVLSSFIELQAANASVDEQLYQSLHGHGSMNVVVAVFAIILIGLFITLYRIERKITRLEKEIKN